MFSYQCRCFAGGLNSLGGAYTILLIQDFLLQICSFLNLKKKKIKWLQWLVKRKSECHELVSKSITWYIEIEVVYWELFCIVTCEVFHFFLPVLQWKYRWQLVIWFHLPFCLVGSTMIWIITTQYTEIKYLSLNWLRIHPFTENVIDI